MPSILICYIVLLPYLILVSAFGGSSSYASGSVHVSKISASGYVVCLRANSSGNIILYVAANYKVPAGNYLLALGLAE